MIIYKAVATKDNILEIENEVLFKIHQGREYYVSELNREGRRYLFLIAKEVDSDLFGGFVNLKEIGANTKF